MSAVLQPSRRSILAWSVAVAASGSLTACRSSGNDGPSTTGGPSSSRAWTFTDDRGVTVDLPETPTRIIAQAFAAGALISMGIRPVGVFGNYPLKDNPELTGLDLTGIRSVGEEFGEINLEAIAALQPDLVSTGYYPVETALGGFNADDSTTVRNLERLAPIVAITSDGSAEHIITRYEDLARTLGADLAAGAVAGEKADFQAAESDFKQAVETKPALTVLVISAAPDALYVADPSKFPEFQDYEKWGLDIVTPSGVPRNSYWKTLSWEEWDAYNADVLYYDARPGAPTPDEIAAKVPVWDRIPAVQAGQLVPWYPDTYSNYGIYADHLDDLTAAIDDADENVAA